MRKAHASLVVGVGNVLTHERNRERKREGRERRKERDKASRVALMSGRPYVPSLDAIPMLRVPLYRRRRSSQERSDGIARCHNHRATSTGDAIVEIHVRSIAMGDRLIRGKLLRGFSAVYSLAQQRTAQGRGSNREIPSRAEAVHCNISQK